MAGTHLCCALDKKNKKLSNFHFDPGSRAIDRFKSDYVRRFGQTPNRFAMIGYDTAQFILKTLRDVVNPTLIQEAIAEQPPYQGLITDIDFRGGNINQQLMVFRLTGSGARLVKE